MRWPPRWLGEIYSKLYYYFGMETFTFEEALARLGVPRDRLMVAFSKLHSMLALTVFERRRPRVYRLLRPENLALLASGYVRKLEIPQEKYLNIIYDVFRAVRRRFGLRAFAVYGSVARGEAKNTSDIDILVISEDFNGSIASRIDRLLEATAEVGGEVRWLIGRGIYPTLSMYPLRPDEAGKLPLLLLDLVEDARVVYDDGLLGSLLEEMRARLARLGARRVRLPNGSWFWDIKPDYSPYEVMEL